MQLRGVEMGDEGGGIGGRFGKMRKLLDEKVVSKLKDSDTRDNVMHQVGEHADTIKDAGMAMASRFMGGGGGDGEKRAAAADEAAGNGERGADADERVEAAGEETGDEER